ncbi:MAG: hypothetical protein LC130_14475 [Bryobacterales bacterium]|nr:hypothetical protein [Bryobacterales bacterium]MCZ2288588.1 hypothetical protein [Anaerolineales bacterium]
MDYQINFSASVINEQELTDLVTPIARVVGASVRVERVYIVSTDDGEVGDILETLADSILRSRKKTKTEDVQGGGKARRGGKKVKAIGRHSYRLEGDPGIVLSKQAINKALAAREIARGTVFVNGAGERFVILPDSDADDAPFVMIREPQA